MNYGVILAGGTGSRMKSLDIPKQYYKINGIPIIIYTLNAFIESNCFDYIYLAISERVNAVTIAIVGNITGIHRFNKSIA